jgi:hypothetical protein
MLVVTLRRLAGYVLRVLIADDHRMGLHFLHKLLIEQVGLIEGNNQRGSISSHPLRHQSLQELPNIL